MKKGYLIKFEYEEDIIIEIEKKNRPNNLTDEEIITEYLNREYGDGIAEVIELDDIEVVKL